MGPGSSSAGRVGIPSKRPARLLDIGTTVIIIAGNCWKSLTFYRFGRVRKPWMDDERALWVRLSGRRTSVNARPFHLRTICFVLLLDALARDAVIRMTRVGS
jgi:hypothetical protein